MYKYKITNTDLENGPFFISKSGYYYLCEDITINFLKNKNDIWKHNKDNNFGFTAGIIIDTCNVVLDLNGFTIQQSIQDYCLQRFFALIQLNNMPFIIGAGPILEKRTQLETGKNITIKNGTLGLSSHQAILGNNNINVKLQNLKINNFEVSGITLNAVHKLQIERTNIGPSNNDVVITPFFAGFIFIHKLLQTIQVMDNREDVQNQIQLILDKIQTFYIPYINAIYSITYLNELKNMFVDDLFINYNGLTPCNMHGIKITGQGPSVNEFHESISDINSVNSKNTQILSTTIKNLKASVDEELLLSYKENCLMIGAGVKVSFNLLLKSPLTMPVILDINSLINNYPDLNTLIKTNIDDYVITILNKIINDEILTDEESKNFEIVRNKDTMGHINKGIMGIRLGSTVDCYCNDIEIKYIDNYGKLSDNYEYYRDKYNIKKVIIPDSGTDGKKNLTGSYSMGFISSAVVKSVFNDMYISNIFSKYNASVGLFINNKSCNINVKNIRICNIKSNEEYNDDSTLLVDEKSKKICLNNIKIE